MAAVLCLMGPVTFPVGLVPISLANLAVSLAAYLLGIKCGTLSVIVYLLAGFVGIPVFSGFVGGVGKLAGPTGGYLVGYVFHALIGGMFVEHFRQDRKWSIFGLTVGLSASYVWGTCWFVALMRCPVWHALTAGVLPFVVFDIVKIIAAVLLGERIRACCKIEILKN